MKKERADKLLADRRLAPTRQKAQALIMAGLVSTAGRRIEKPGQPLAPDAPIEIEKPLPYVGRGGLKLQQALDVWSIDPEGRICADIGSSTGGFTDCLLQRGAARVYAVDVDTRQLDDRLRRDPRVVPIGMNARNIAAADFPVRPSLIVMDVSFISVLKILPALRKAFSEDPSAPPLLLSLIKPQFEAGKGQVGKKGIVRDPALHAAILARIAGEAALAGFALRGIVRCDTRGQKGNQEFFAHWIPGGVEPAAEDVLKWVAEAARNETD